MPLRLITVLLTLISLTVSGQSVVNPSVSGDMSARISKELGKPVFRKNAGQFEPGVLYRMTSGQTSVAFFKNKIQFGMRKPGREKMKSRVDLGSTAFQVWEMQFQGMNPNTRLAGSMQHPSVYSRFRSGDEKAIPIEEFGRLTYYNVYEGIDLVFYLDEKETLKYDFIVHAGADFSAIRLQYNGLKHLKTDAKGNLVLVTPWGNRIREGKPVSWLVTPSGKEKVTLNYTVSGKTLSFTSDKPVSNAWPLVIDPMMLDWSTYFYGKLITGSTWGWTYLLDMDIDKDNYVYAVGMTTESFPTKVGTYDTSMASGFNYEGFLAKMSLNADSLLLFTYLGGSSYEYILSVAVNSLKQPVVSGITYSSDFPVTSGAYDKTGGSGTGYRGFITKFSANFKTLVYSTFFGKSNAWGTVIQSMQLTANGDVVFTGYTSAQDFPTTTGCLQSTYGGGSNDGFLTRLSADGSKLIYSTYFGGTGQDQACDLSLNAAEDVYLVGSTSNSNFPLTIGAKGPFKYSNSDAMDGFVARIQSDGKKLLWSKMMGGSSLDYFEGLYVNSNDELYIAGFSNSTDFYTTSGVIQPTNRGGYDHVIVKMNKSGTNVFYSTYLGGSGDDYFYSGYFWNSNIRITANVKDEPIIGGATRSTNYPVTWDAIQPTNKASGNFWNTNLAITKLSYDGSKILYGTYFGGSYYEYPTVLKVKKISCMSSILYGGLTLSKDYPTTSGVYREKAKSGSTWYYHGFMSRFRDTLYTEPINFQDDFVECDKVYEILDAKNRGASFLWSDGSKMQTLIVQDTGTYWVTATYGCDTVTDTIHISLHYSPHLDLKPDTTLCNNSTGLILDAQNDTIVRRYLWSTNDTTQKIKVTQPGVYSVKVSTPFCGDVSDTIAVKFLKKPVIPKLRDSVFCDKVNWLLNVDSFGPGTKYKWSTGDTLYTTQINNTGTHSLRISNFCGNDSAKFTTSLLYTPKVDLPVDTLVCDQFAFKYKVGRPNNEETYNWYDPVNKIYFGTDDSMVLNFPTVLAVSIENRCGQAKDSITVIQRLTPVVRLGNDSTYCDKINTVLKVGKTGNSESYLWNNNSTQNTLPVTGPGLYWVKVSNMCGTRSDSVQFFEKRSLKFDLGNDTTYCDAVSRILNITQADPATTYSWNDGSSGPVLNVSKPGKYFATMKNFCGSVSDTVRYYLLLKPQTNLGSDKVFCDVLVPQSYTTGTPGNGETYLWSNMSTTTTATFNTPGKHWVQVTNQCGVATDTVALTVVSSPVVDLGPDTALCGVFSLPLDAGLSGVTYLWSPGGETSKTILATKQTKYSVLVTDGNGCTGTGFMQIKDDCKSRWYIPDAFSPNGDGINDLFTPYFLNCEDYSIKIMNGWGELVYSSENQLDAWDGTANGVTVQQGQYAYMIQFRSSEDKHWYQVKGFIAVLK